MLGTSLLWLASALGAAQAPGLTKMVTRLGDLAPGPDRVLRATELLLGKPYELHPLGEAADDQGLRQGRRSHQKPRFRLDAFDCQTFVETALALGESTSVAGTLPAMDDIRYAGRPAFAERNHFMMSQWIPSNQAKGYLAPLPADAVAEKTITAKSWRTRETAIDLPPDRIPLGTFSLPLTTLDSLLAKAAQIPSGTLMLVVRADRARFPDRVTHLGFVVQSGGHTFFRHASDVFERVVDEPVEHFVARNRRYAYPVEGVSLFSVLPNGSRVAGLASGSR
jgi:hypothetical protein